MAKINVLVIEDDPCFAAAERLYLENKGCNVVVVDDGFKGIHEFLHSKIPYDIVVSDYGLPTIDGMDTIDIIRILRKYKNAYPVLVLQTAYGDSSMRTNKYFKVDKLLLKPFDLDEFNAILAPFNRQD